MRLPNLVRAATGVLLATSLSGCAPSDASAPPQPAATFAAPYATDEEALAAAEEAYTEYTRVSDQILHDGGADAERLAEVAVGSFLEESLVELREFESNGYRATGEVVSSDFVLQRYSPKTGPLELISVYLCSDVSAVEIFDSSGISLVANERDDLATMQVAFTFNNERRQLLVSDQQLWASGTC